MMGGMAVDEVNCARIYKPSRKGALRRRDLIAPVAAPVERCHNEVAGASCLADFGDDFVRD
jgi:hypothetical protein